MKQCLTKQALRLAASLTLILPVMAQQAEPKPAAQELDYTLLNLLELLDTPVVSASKISEKASVAPATIYVIREDDIVRNGYYELKDALENIPGFTAIDLGFFLFGGQRGFVGNLSQTLILVNGREMQNLIAAETFISHQFATHNIKQIEVIQGPGSALYGANALVGVINIITKDQSADFKGAEVSTDFGTGSTSAVNAVFSVHSGDWKVSGSVRTYHSDGADLSRFVNDSSRFSEGWADYQKARLDATHHFRNKAQAQPVSFRIDYKGFYAGLESFRLQSNKGLENVSLDYESQFDRREFDLTYAGWSGALSPSTDFMVEEQHYKERFWGANYRFDATVYTNLGLTAPNPIPASNLSDFSGYYSQENSSGSTRDKITAQVTHRFAFGGNVVAGLVYDRQDVLGIAGSNSDPTPPFDDNMSASNPLHLPFFKTDKKSIYAQYKQGFFSEKLMMTLGARMDKQSLYGNVSTFRGGLVWRYSEKGTAKMLYGQAFREPNIFEQGAQLGVYNTSLKPAKMDTFELSANQGIGSFMVGNLTVYRNLAHDLIVPQNTYLFTNTTSVKSSTGAETLLNFQLSRQLKADLGYAYTDSGKTWYAGQWLNDLGVYRSAGSLGLNYELAPELRFNLRINHYGQVDAKHGNPNITQVITIPAADKVSLTLSGQSDLGSMKGTYQLTVRNLFDKDIYEPNIRTGGPKQFILPGREVFARIGFKF